MTDGKETPGQIPTNVRLLVLIEEVARAGAPVTPTYLGEVLGLPKPTVHRLLNTAEDEGFLQRHIDGRSYGPGRRLRKISINTLSSQRIRAERQRIMRALAVTTGETVNLSTPGREGMVYLDRVETHWPLRIQLPVGTQVPFHCTASGKMYLATLRPEKLERLFDAIELEARTARTLVDRDALRDEIRLTRKRDYAIDNEEFMKGMTAVAVGIRDDMDRLLCTLSIHAPDQRSPLENLERTLEGLRKGAADLEALALE